MLSYKRLRQLVPLYRESIKMENNSWLSSEVKYVRSNLAHTYADGFIDFIIEYERLNKEIKKHKQRF